MQYHSLGFNRAFSANPGSLNILRKTVEDDLTLWLESLKSLLDKVGIEADGLFNLQESTHGGDNMDIPAVAGCPVIVYYGLYLFHTIYIALYGKMDLKRMYSDVEWLASSDFIAAGTHALACAKVRLLLLSFEFIRLIWGWLRMVEVDFST